MLDNGNKRCQVFPDCEYVLPPQSLRASMQPNSSLDGEPVRLDISLFMSLIASLCWYSRVALLPSVRPP